MEVLIVDKDGSIMGVTAVNLFASKAENGGALVEPDVTKLSVSLRKAATRSDSERIEKGKKLPDWVCDHYNLDEIDKLWIDLYESTIRN